MKNFVNLSNIDKKELRKIIDHAKKQKKKDKKGKGYIKPLKVKTLIMIFEKK